MSEIGLKALGQISDVHFFLTGIMVDLFQDDENYRSDHMKLYSFRILSKDSLFEFFRKITGMLSEPAAEFFNVHREYRCTGGNVTCLLTEKPLYFICGEEDSVIGIV